MKKRAMTQRLGAARRPGTRNQAGGILAGTDGESRRHVPRNAGRTATGFVNLTRAGGRLRGGDPLKPREAGARPSLTWLDGYKSPRKHRRAHVRSWSAQKDELATDKAPGSPGPK